MKVVIVVFFSLLSNLALAGSGSGAVRIEHVGSWNNKNIVFFYTEQVAYKPECNVFQGRWAINLDTEAGKAQYSFILAAQASGSDIVIRGLHTCNLWFNSEDVHWVGYP